MKKVFLSFFLFVVFVLIYGQDNDCDCYFFTSLTYHMS